MKNKKLSKETKQNYNEFLQKFSLEKIKEWDNPFQYVIGDSANHKSFCYYVECLLKEIGEIRGANASKFGLYYGKYGKNDTEVKLRATKKNFDGDVKKAFETIKNELAKLIEQTQKMPVFRDIVKGSVFSEVFGYKIMYLYNNKIMLPCFDFDDMKYFEKCLGLKVSDTYEKAQRNLLNYFEQKEDKIDHYSVMTHLYNTYGRSDKLDVIKANKKADEDLQDEINSIKNLTRSTKYNPNDSGEIGKPTIINGRKVYPRRKEVSIYAIQVAKFKCCFDENHKTFKRRSDGSPYLEPHHLVPMSFQGDKQFEKISLDVHENVIPLCSHCHNEIHYGKGFEKLVRALFRKRKELLSKRGIIISEDNLVELYKRINSKKDI